VTNQRIGIVHSRQERFDDARVVIAYAGKRNHSLKTNFRALIRKRSSQPFRGTAVTDFAQRSDRHLPHVHVSVFHRDEQRRQSFTSPNIGKAQRCRGSYVWRIVFPERTLECSDDIFTRIVGMFDEVTDCAFTHGWLFRGYVTKGRRKGSW